MKHIFIVHSPITFLVSEQYTKERNLPAEDCIYISCRNYEIPVTRRNTSLCVCYPNDFFCGANDILSPIPHILCAYRNKQVLEDKISKLTSHKPFLLYPFYTASHFVSILVSMETCQGYYIIEEGTSAYCSREHLFNTFIGWKSLWVYRLMRIPFHSYYLLKDFCFSDSSHKYKGTIGLSQQAFPYLGGDKIVLHTPFAKQKLPVTPTLILSIDCSLELFHIKEKHIITILYLLREAILQKYNAPITIAYKYHPYYRQHPDRLDMWERLLLKNFGDFTLFEINTEYALENLLNQYHCDFYSDYSSVGFYAHMMGCKCYSYGEKLCKLTKNSNYSRAFHAMPKEIMVSYYTL